MSHFAEDIHHRSSLRIGSIIPEFIQTQYPQFTAFVKAYYEFLEQNDTNPIQSVYVQQPGVITILTGNSTVIGSNTTFSNVNRGQDVGANTSLQQYDRIKVSETVFTVRTVINNTSLLIYDNPERTFYGNTFFLETEKSTRQAAGALRQILTFHEIDSTIPDFLAYFQDTYLRQFPQQGSNAVALIPQILNFYQSRGSEDAYRFLFRALFGKEITIRYPRDYVFTTSDAIYEQPYVMKIDATSPRAVYRVKTTASSNNFIVGELVQTDPALPANNSFATVKQVINSTAIDVYSIYGSLTQDKVLTGKSSGVTRTIAVGGNATATGAYTTGLTFGGSATGNVYALESREIVGLTSNVRARVTQVRPELEGTNTLLSLNLEEVTINDIPFNILLSDNNGNDGDKLLFTTFGIPPLQQENKIYDSVFVQEQKPGVVFEPGERVSTLPLEDPLRIEGTVVSGVSGFIVESGGSGFKIGDLIFVPNSPPTINGFGAIGRVSALSQSEINAVNIDDPGEGYYNGLPLVVDNTGTGGTGLEGFVSRITAGQLTTERYFPNYISTLSGAYTTQMNSYNVVVSGVDATTLGLSSGSLLLIANSAINITTQVEVSSVINSTAIALKDYPSANVTTGTANLAVIQETSDPDIIQFTIGVPGGINPTADVDSSLEDIDYFLQGISLQDVLSWQLVVDDETFSEDRIAADGLILVNTFSSSNNFTLGELITAGSGGTGNVLSVINSTAVILESPSGTFSPLTSLTGGTSGFVRTQFGAVGNTVVLAQESPQIGYADWSMDDPTSGLYEADLATSIEPVLLAASVEPIFIRGVRTAIGEVSEITVTGVGRGYLLGNPTVVVITPDQPKAANGQLISRSTFPYVPAILSVIAANGVVGAVDIITSGSGYSGAGTFTVTPNNTSSQTGSGTVLKLVLGSLSEGTPRFKSTRSWASSDQYMQDESTYQPFAYVLSVEEDRTNYIDPVKKFVHPAGGKLISDQTVTIDLYSGITNVDVLRNVDVLITLVDADLPVLNITAGNIKANQAIPAGPNAVAAPGEELIVAPEATLIPTISFLADINNIVMSAPSEDIYMTVAPEITSNEMDVTVAAFTIHLIIPAGTNSVAEAAVEAIVAPTATRQTEIALAADNQTLTTVLAPETSTWLRIPVDAVQVSVTISSILTHLFMGVNNNPAISQYGNDQINQHGDEVVETIDDSKPRIINISNPTVTIAITNPV